MSGDPRFQIRMCERMFQKAHERARRAGLSTSEWLRRALLRWNGEPVGQPVKQLSVRLDHEHIQHLETLASHAGKSKTRAFALWVEHILDNSIRLDAPKRQQPPAMDDHEAWAAQVLQAARNTRHKFGERKAFIAGVIEELTNRYRPDDPEHFAETVKRLLLRLQQQGMVQLARADLVTVMDPALVAASEIRSHMASFHFVDLTRVLADPWASG